MDENSCQKCGKQLCNKYFAKKHMEKCKKQQIEIEVKNENEPSMGMGTSTNNYKPHLRKSRIVVTSEKKKHNVPVAVESSQSSQDVDTTSPLVRLNESVQSRGHFEPNVVGHDSIVYTSKTMQEKKQISKHNEDNVSDNDEDNVSDNDEKDEEDEKDDGDGDEDDDGDDNESEQNDEPIYKSKEEKVSQDIVKFMLVKEMRLFITVADVINRTPYQSSSILRKLVDVGIENISRIIRLLDENKYNNHITRNNKGLDCDAKQDMMKELMKVFGDHH